MFSDEDEDYGGDFRAFAGYLLGTYSLSGKEGWLDSVYVASPYRRQGLMNVLFCQ